MPKNQTKASTPVPAQESRSPVTFDVRVYPVKDSKYTLANANVDINGVFAIRGVKVIRGEKGPFVCGRPCCCNTCLPDFAKVSIKMAKLQGLSLNPTKISGVCGRLMCCLKFENDYYAEMYKKMPKVGSRAKTPDGEGVVESNDILKQQVKVKIMDKDGSFDVKTYDLKDVSARVHQSVEPDDSSDDEELKKLED